MPQIHVRLFAGLHDLVGQRDLVIDMPPRATIGQLRERLGEEYPVVQPFLSTLVCAVAEEYVPSDHVLEDGDNVELFPPISGGAGRARDREPETWKLEVATGCSRSRASH
ncbi:MAG: MoaD/ThiS family protein [Dehalococcoidia bacterium]